MFLPCYSTLYQWQINKSIENSCIMENQECGRNYKLLKCIIKNICHRYQPRLKWIIQTDIEIQPYSLPDSFKYYLWDKRAKMGLWSRIILFSLIKFYLQAHPKSSSVTYLLIEDKNSIGHRTPLKWLNSIPEWPIW